MSKNAIVSVKEIKSTSRIDINCDDKSLKELILIAQDTKLSYILGTTLYNQIQTAYDNFFDSATPIPLDLKQLIEKVKQYLIYQVVSDFIMINHYKLSNKGTYRLNDDNATSASTSEIEWYRTFYDNATNSYKKNLIDFLKDNNLITNSSNTDTQMEGGVYFNFDKSCSTGNQRGDGGTKLEEVDPVWNAEKSNYYTSEEVDTLLSGFTFSASDTLQDVTDRGNETSNSLVIGGSFSVNNGDANLLISGVGDNFIGLSNGFSPSGNDIGLLISSGGSILKNQSSGLDTNINTVSVDTSGVAIHKTNTSFLGTTNDSVNLNENGIELSSRLISITGSNIKISGTTSFSNPVIISLTQSVGATTSKALYLDNSGKIIYGTVSITERDTLNTVTSRGATTSNNVKLFGRFQVDNVANDNAKIDFLSGLFNVSVDNTVIDGTYTDYSQNNGTITFQTGGLSFNNSIGLSNQGIVISTDKKLLISGTTSINSRLIISLTQSVGATTSKALYLDTSGNVLYGTVSITGTDTLQTITDRGNTTTTPVILNGTVSINNSFTVTTPLITLTASNTNIGGTLSVYGNAVINGALSTSVSQSISSGGNVIASGANGQFFGSNLTNVGFVNGDISISPLQNILFKSGNAEKMRLTTGGSLVIGSSSNSPHSLVVIGTSSYFSGLIGVGTASPSFAVDISYTTGQHIRVTNPATNGQALIQLSAGSGGFAQISSSSGDFYLTNSQGGSNIIFRTANTERMRLTSPGGLLIGTTSNGSTASLFVNGKVRVLTTLNLSNNAAAVSAGLTAGEIYRNGDVLMIVN